MNIGTAIQIVVAILGGEHHPITGTYGFVIGATASLLSQSALAEHISVGMAVLKGGDAEAIAFKNAVTSECNMTAIAVS
jgi:hypothetical protein